MNSLYPVGSVYIALNAAIEDGNLTDDEIQKVVDQQITNELVAQERAVLIAKDLKSLDGYIDMVRSEIDELKAKIARAERMQDSIMKGVANYMTLTGKDKLDAGPYSFAFRKSTTCEIIDEEKIPAEFKTVETIVKVNKNDLKAAAKKGDVVDGIHGFVLVEHKNLNLK